MGPYIKSDNSTNKMMSRVIIALFPIILFSFYKNGILCYDGENIYTLFKPLIIIGFPCLCTFLFETVYLYFTKDEKLIDIIRNNYSYMPGLFLGLILPINTPLPIILVGSLISVFIGKVLFGGFGQNIFNPALIGRLFIITMYALTINNMGGYLNSSELDAVTSATPLTNANLIEGIGTYNDLVMPYGGLKYFLLGFIPGCLGETPKLLILLAFIYLTVTKTIKWRIPVFYVGTVFISTFFIAYMNNTGIWYPAFEVLSGGLLFGAVFMATDPVTSPISKYGQVLYGICLGILTVTLRYLTSYPEAVLTSILTMNMLVFIIEDMSINSNFKKYKRILPILVLILILGLVTYVVGNKFKESSVDKNFEILEKETKGSLTRYVVTQVGYSSKLKIKIEIKDDEVIRLEYLDYNDSFFSKVLDSNYSEVLIDNQDSLNDCDTVSGATISSTAVKKALINTLRDYRGES